MSLCTDDRLVCRFGWDSSKPAHQTVWMSLIQTGTTNSHLYRVTYIPDVIFFLWRCDPTRVMISSFLRFLDHTQRRTTVGRNPLDEWSARRRDLYLTTHNSHNRQISMPPVGFEPTISARERPQTYALDRAATGTGRCIDTINSPDDGHMTARNM